MIRDRGTIVAGWLDHPSGAAAGSGFCGSTTSSPEADPVSSAPSSGLPDRQDGVLAHQAATENLISCHFPADLKQERSLGIGPVAPPWGLVHPQHKLMQTMREHDDSKPLSGQIQVDDAFWGDERRDGKRGRGAAAKTSAYRFNRRFELHRMVDRLAYVACRKAPFPYRLDKMAEVHT
jgi:hypothetical protein